MRKALFAEEQMVRSSARRIASRWRWWPSGTGSASRRSTHGASVSGAFRRTTSRRLKQLETEKARLKKLVVERGLEIEVMKEVAAKNVWSGPSVQGFWTR
jgi:hypothetical protein